jgi:Ca-activated chloride channel family protein
MRKAAQFGRGTHTHIGDLGEVGEKMGALFEQIASPLAANIAIKWPVPVEAYPNKIPDLYAGEPVLVAVKSGSMPLVGQVSVAGDMVGQPWSRQVQLAPRPTGVGSHPGVASLWARQKISSLLDERQAGEDASVVRREVLDVALTHTLLSPYTSFVAVEEQISRPPTNALNKSAVPNSRPLGQSPQSFAYPRTATTAAAKVFLGTLLLFFALITLVVRREEVDHVPLAGV